ncbi:MAG: SDR family oxidoreductase [Bacteroidota bacterium]
MDNKVCVVTGGNSGIGYETAKAMAAKGAYVILVCRNEEKGQAARSMIMEQTQNHGVDVCLCDFSIQHDIHKAADVICSRFKTIDVLINNHGFIAGKRMITVDDLERTFAVNHMGYFLFTRLLLPAIYESDYARIVNVASEAHRTGSFEPENLQLETGFSPMKAYGNSKLFNILFTKELARRISHTHITANCLHPGVVRSNFASDGNHLLRWLFAIGKPFMISPASGAKTSIYLATSDEVDEVNGAYFKNAKPAVPRALALDSEAAEELWDISSRLCGLESELLLPTS